MKNMKMYEPDDKLINIISDNYTVLQSLGAFGINLGLETRRCVRFARARK